MRKCRAHIKNQERKTGIFLLFIHQNLFLKFRHKNKKQEYLTGFTYYKMSNLDSRIGNPDQVTVFQHCNALQSTANHCKALQHTSTNCNATHCNALQRTATHCNALQHTAMHCNALHHTTTHCNALQRTAAHCSTLQHTATHCNALQRTAAHCSALQHTLPCRGQSLTIHLYNY